MPKNFLQGIRTKIYYTPMSVEGLALPTLAAPIDSPVTTTALIASAATTIAVTALTNPIPAGVAITLTASGATLIVYTTASAATGATTLTVLSTSGGIATGATGTYTAMLQLKGGTASAQQLTNADTVIKNYLDAGAKIAYDDGIVTGSSWNLTYSFSALSDDLGQYRLNYTVQNALAGVRGYVRRELAAPPGYARGEMIEGLVDVTSQSKDAPVDNVVGGQITFAGRGAPIFTPPSLT